MGLLRKIAAVKEPEQDDYILDRLRANDQKRAQKAWKNYIKKQSSYSTSNTNQHETANGRHTVR